MAGSLLLCGFIDFDIVGIFLDILRRALRFNDSFSMCNTDGRNPTARLAVHDSTDVELAG